MAEFGLDFIRKLEPCSWRYTGDLDDGVVHFGFIAQAVNQLTSHEDFAFVQRGEDGIYRIVLGEFIGPIVKAVQELDARLTRLEAEKEQHEPRNMGDNQVGNHDPVGHGHDLAENMGDLRNFGEAPTVQVVFWDRPDTGQTA